VALSAFDDKSHPPQADDINQILGAAARFWQEIIAHVSETHAPITELWSFTSARYGWSLRLKRKDRVILYFTPQKGQFLTGIVLGEKAARAGHENGLPETVLNLIDSAPKYAEGRGIRMAVTQQEDVEVVKELVKLKMGV
jgi:hypothetical protein